MNKLTLTNPHWCLQCGCRLLAGPERKCIVCKLMQYGIVLPRQAIECRMLPVEDFASPSLIDLGKRYPTTEALSLISISSIKHREQVQQLNKRAQTNGLRPLSVMRSNFEKAVNRSEQQGQSILISEFRELLHSQFQGCCAYCKQPLPETWDVETTLGSHLKHNSQKYVYWKAQYALGNIVPSCASCNAMKGAIERRGILLLRSLFKGDIEIPDIVNMEAPGLNLTFHREPVRLVEIDKPTLPLSEDFPFLVSGIALRTMAINHVCVHQEGLYLSWSAMRRTLSFGCKQCRPSGGTLSIPLIVRETPMQRQGRKRTEQHREQQNAKNTGAKIDNQVKKDAGNVPEIERSPDEN